MIRVVLPAHLRTLAKVHQEVELEIQGPVNSEMRKEQLVVKGQRATITKAAKSISSIG